MEEEYRKREKAKGKREALCAVSAHGGSRLQYTGVGPAVRSQGRGRVQVYELDFGRDHKVITHVFWADPARDSR